MFSSTRFRRQVRSLVHKNHLLVCRRRAHACFELFTPFILVVLLGIVDLSVNVKVPQPRATELTQLHSDGTMPVRCRIFDSEYGSFGYGQPLPDESSWCIPIVVAPLSPTASEVMLELARRNGYEQPSAAAEIIEAMRRGVTPPDAGRTIAVFNTVDRMKNWLREHPGRAAVGVVFGDSSTSTTGASEEISWHSVRYELWYNRSATVYGWYAGTGQDVLRAQSAGEAIGANELVDSALLLSAQRMVDEAALAVFARRAGRSTPLAGSGLALTLKQYPKVRADADRSLSGSFGALFITMGLTLPMLAAVVRIVSEKEHHVAGAMRSIGVAPGAYWLSYWAHAISMALLSVVLVYLGGVATRAPIFVLADGSVLMCVCFVYLINMASLSFFVASLTHQVRTATIGAVVVLLAGAAVAVLAQSPATNPTAFLFWEPGFPPAVRALLAMLLPPVNLIKILSDATVRTTRPLVFNVTSGRAEFADGGAFDWAAVSSFTQNRTASVLATERPAGEALFVTPPPADAIGYMLLSTVLSFALAWCGASRAACCALSHTTPPVPLSCAHCSCGLIAGTATSCLCMEPNHSRLISSSCPRTGRRASLLGAAPRGCAACVQGCTPSFTSRRVH